MRYFRTLCREAGDLVHRFMCINCAARCHEGIVYQCEELRRPVGCEICLCEVDLDR